MPSKGKVDYKEVLINKSILGCLSLVFAIFAVVGAATHILVGAIFMMLFMASFGSFIGMSKIKEFFQTLDGMDWW